METSKRGAEAPPCPAAFCVGSHQHFCVHLPSPAYCLALPVSLNSFLATQSQLIIHPSIQLINDDRMSAGMNGEECELWPQNAWVQIPPLPESLFGSFSFELLYETRMRGRGGGDATRPQVQLRLSGIPARSLLLNMCSGYVPWPHIWVTSSCPSNPGESSYLKKASLRAFLCVAIALRLVFQGNSPRPWQQCMLWGQECSTSHLCYQAPKPQ